jgi:hypothetical protein
MEQCIQDVFVRLGKGEPRLLSARAERPGKTGFSSKTAYTPLYQANALFL